MLIACHACHRQYEVSSLEPGSKVRCLCGKITVVPVPQSRATAMSHCFACGGPLKPGVYRCAYCGGNTSLLMHGGGDACPECFARLARGARFCAECGVPIAPSAVVKAIVSTQCPRCRGQLAQCEGPSGTFTECLTCGGLWLPEKLFRALLQQRREGVQDPLLAAGIVAAARGAVTAPEDVVRYLACPNCAELMHRRNFGAGSGVIIDTCRGHGVWFDALELEQVMRFAQDQPERAAWNDQVAPSAARSAAARPTSGGGALDAPDERPPFLLRVLGELLSVWRWLD